MGSICSKKNKIHDSIPSSNSSGHIATFNAAGLMLAAAMPTENPKLSGSKVTSSNSTGQSNGTMIDAYVNAAILQPVFDTLNGVPDLLAHQKLAKQNAESWPTSVRSSLYSTNASLLAYCHTFASVYKPVYDSAGKVHDPQSRKTFVQGLQILHDQIQQHATGSDAARKVLVDFEQKIAVDAANLAGDHAKIVSVYEGDKGKLAGWQTEATADQVAMNKDMSMIAGGAVLDVVGGLMIVVGVLAEIETAGASTALIAGGIGVIAGGSTMIGLATKDYDSKVIDLADVTKKIKTTTAEITAANHLKGQTESLHTLAQNAVSALDDLNKAWTALGTEFKQTIDAVNAVDPTYTPVYLQALLKAARLDWDDVAKDAQRIHDTLIGGGDGLKVVVNKNGPPQASAKPEGMAMFAVHRPMSQRTQNVMTEPKAASETAAAILKYSTSVSQSADAAKQVFESAPQLGTRPVNVNTSITAMNNAILPAVSDAADFVKALKICGNLSDQLQSLTTLPKDQVAKQAAAVFSSVAAQIDSIRSTQCTAAIKSSDALRRAAALADSDIRGWSAAEVASVATEKKEIDAAKSSMQRLGEQRAKMHVATTMCYFAPPACIAMLILQKKMNKLAHEMDHLASTLRTDNAMLAAACDNLAWATRLLVPIESIANASNHLNASMEALTQEMKAAAGMPNELILAYVTAEAHALAAQLAGIAGIHVPGDAPVVFTLAASSDAVVDEGGAEEAGQVRLAQGLQVTFAAFTVSNQAAMQQTMQPLLDLMIDKSILTDQSLAQGHATEWLRSIQHAPLFAMTAFKGAVNTLLSVISTVVLQVEAERQDEATLGVIILEKTLDDLGTELHTQGGTVGQFLDRLRDDQLRFYVVDRAILKEFEGKDGKLVEIVNRISNLKEQIAANNAKLAKGATEAVAKALAFEVAIGISMAAGALITVPAAAVGASEVAVLLPKIGNAVIKGATQAGTKAATNELNNIMTEDFSANAQQVIDEYGKLIQEQATVRASVAVMRTLSANVTQLVGAVTEIQEAMEDVDLSLVGCQRSITTAKILLGKGSTQTDWKEAASVLTDLATSLQDPLKMARVLMNSATMNTMNTIDVEWAV